MHDKVIESPPTIDLKEVASFISEYLRFHDIQVRDLSIIFSDMNRTLLKTFATKRFGY